MDFAAILVVEFVYAIANLFLVSAGLAVVFGMMRVINLAHGEFMMLGGYATIVAVKAGMNVFVAMLVAAPLFVGLFGLACERLVIRHLYGRVIDTMLATWGLSLLLIGTVTMIFGNTTTGIPTPIPGFRMGGYQVNGYNFFIIIVVTALICLMFATLKWTRAGLVARGTMQGAAMASALGHNTARVYMATFFAGSALAGLAGGVLAPLVGLVPAWGGAYIAKAFIAVIAGGPSVVAGLLSGSTFFGFVNQLFTFAATPVIGEVALLVAAILLLRLFPRGITGRFLKGYM